MTERVDKIARRNEILEAAVRVFSRKGFYNSRMVDIAREAGIGKGTIYKYYCNKNELLLAGFADYVQQIEAHLNRITKSQQSPSKRIRSLLRGFVEIYQRDGISNRVFFDYWIEGIAGRGQPEIDLKPLYERVREVMKRLLDEGIALGEIRSSLSPQSPAILLAALEGIFLQWLVDPSFDLGGACDALLDTLFDGLASQRETAGLFERV